MPKEIMPGVVFHEGNAKEPMGCIDLNAIKPCSEEDALDMASKLINKMLRESGISKEAMDRAVLESTIASEFALSPMAYITQGPAVYDPTKVITLAIDEGVFEEVPKPKYYKFLSRWWRFIHWLLRLVLANRLFIGTYLKWDSWMDKRHPTWYFRAVYIETLKIDPNTKPSKVEEEYLVNDMVKNGLIGKEALQDIVAKPGSSSN